VGKISISFFRNFCRLRRQHYNEFMRRLEAEVMTEAVVHVLTRLRD
jgi:hypothetical protein